MKNFGHLAESNLGPHWNITNIFLSDLPFYWIANRFLLRYLKYMENPKIFIGEGIRHNIICSIEFRSLKVTKGVTKI